MSKLDTNGVREPINNKYRIGEDLGVDQKSSIDAKINQLISQCQIEVKKLESDVISQPADSEQSIIDQNMSLYQKH